MAARDLASVIRDRIGTEGGDLQKFLLANPREKAAVDSRSPGDITPGTFTFGTPTNERLQIFGGRGAGHMGDDELLTNAKKFETLATQKQLTPQEQDALVQLQTEVSNRNLQGQAAATGFLEQELGAPQTVEQIAAEERARADKQRGLLGQISEQGLSDIIRKIKEQSGSQRAQIVKEQTMLGRAGSGAGEATIGRFDEASGQTLADAITRALTARQEQEFGLEGTLAERLARAREFGTQTGLARAGFKQAGRSAGRGEALQAAQLGEIVRSGRERESQGRTGLDVQRGLGLGQLERTEDDKVGRYLGYAEKAASAGEKTAGLIGKLAALGG